MAANGFITTAELNFDTYRANLKEYLKSQAQFADYNFEGSNFAVLLDILAYNTYMNAFYLNMIGSEMFLDSATLPEAVASHAKELNYTPSSRSSSKAVTTLTLVNLDPSAASVTVPKYFRVTTKLNGKSKIFSTQDSYTISKTTNFISANINIYEGNITKEYFTEANTSSVKTRYIISSPNVDISTVDIKVRPSVSVNSYFQYSRAFNLYGLTSTSNSYFIQGYGDNRYEVVFGNGISGRALTPGNIIEITYLDASGTDGDYATSFDASDTLSDNRGNVIGSNQIKVATISPSTGGSERESIDSIKFNAPRYYSTQNRAVTKEDYISLIKINFPSIQSVTVFGGEENVPKQYGKVVIVTKPFGTDVTPDITKTAIGSYLRDRMPLSITPVFEDPDSFYVDILADITFNPSLTSKSASDIKSTALAAIAVYNQDNLQQFNQNLRVSKLVAAIDNSDPSILGNDTRVRMVKRITPTRNSAYTFTFQTHNQLYQEAVGANVQGVTSSTFTYNLDGANISASFADDGEGNLIMTAGSYKQTVGSVDYTTGQVTIDNLTVADYTNYISIYCLTEKEDILIQRDQILTIDPVDVTIVVNTATS